jgi:hypothetical protein
MSGGITLATVASYASIAAAAYSVIGGLTQKGPKGPEAPGAPQKPPEAAKAPDANVFKDKNMQAARAGNSSTMLAGLGGVPSSTLNLGRNTLLGA